LGGIGVVPEPVAQTVIAAIEPSQVVPCLQGFWRAQSSLVLVENAGCSK